MTNKTLSHLLIVIKLNASRALERNFSLRISLSWTTIKPVSNFLSFYVRALSNLANLPYHFQYTFTNTFKLGNFLHSFLYTVAVGHITY